MTPEEIGQEILDELNAREGCSQGFYENALDLKLTIARILTAKIQAALAARTEQCAKIAESDLGVLHFGNENSGSLEEQAFINGAIGAKRSMADAIRALNQPPSTKENKS
jgi:hypothetical protein